MSSENGGVGAVDPQVDRMSHTELGGGAYSENYAPGEVISGKYRLIRPIGRGGMGVVWEAHSELLDIRVAVKLIQQFSSSLEMRQRLLLEARAAARLVDPGVIRIFDCGETAKRDPYIVMELLEGEDLATRLENRGRLAPTEAIRTLLPIVRALGAAHKANIVHRDVKPENVFFTKSLTAEEQPKLFDFGIAKVDVAWEKRLTQAGSTLGSPSYMSPEQAQGNEIDRRSDLWGISVVLYETIAGQLPFDGQSYQAIVHAILCADPKSFLDLGVNEPELWAIIAKGLERDRERRWQSSDDLEEALATWLIDRGVLHDVTGVSLHATRANQLVRKLRSSETARPPNQSGNQLRAQHLELVNTVQHSKLSGFWLGRTRRARYVILMLAVAASGAVMSYGIKRASRKAVPSSAELAVKTERQGAEPVRPIEHAAITPPTPSINASAETPSAEAMPAVAPSPAARTVSAGKSSKTRPKPSSAAPQNEPFKSPFD